MHDVLEKVPSLEGPALMSPACVRCVFSSTEKPNVASSPQLGANRAFHVRGGGKTQKLFGLVVPDSRCHSQHHTPTTLEVGSPKLRKNPLNQVNFESSGSNSIPEIGDEGKGDLEFRNSDSVCPDKWDPSVLSFFLKTA